MSVKTSYVKLQKEWYKKLKESGFNDIEDKTGSVGRGTPRITNRSPLQIEVIESYYAMARNFLLDYEFDSQLEKTIWEYHTEGISARDISQTLRKAGIQDGTHYVTIWKIINKLETLMKVKYLSP